MPPRSPNHFIASLSAEDFAFLAPHFVEVHLQRDDLISEAGQDLQDVYLPLSSIISIIVVMRNGDEVESRTIGREGGFGLLHALGVPISHERMIVQCAGRAVKIRLSILTEAAATRPSLVRCIAAHAQAAYVQLAQSAACNALHPASARLARWLLITRDRLGSEMISLTQEHLSIMLGVQRTTVTALASAFQADGLISYSRGKIKIKDLAGLKARSCECYEATRHSVENTFYELAAPEVERRRRAD